MAEDTVHNSYNPAFFEYLSEVEDKHFWFRSRNRIIATWVRRLTSESMKNRRLLEIGCGTGNVLRILEQVCPNDAVVGMDLFGEGLKYAQKRTSAALVQGDIHQPPFAGAFDIIGLFDVIEHLPDDGQVLEDLKKTLRANGLLLLTVPAHPCLWSYFDEMSRHYRRYRLDELKDKLMKAGFVVEYITPYMMSIFPLVWIGRHLSSFRKHMSNRQRVTSNVDLVLQELRPPIPIVNEALLLLLDIERRWLTRGHILPFGTSLLAVARKQR